MTRVVVVRHGETDWNRNGRMQGWAPVSLNETGRAQADRVGRYLSAEYDIERVVASDLERTRETTEYVCAHLGDVPVTFDRAWRERDLGIYQGLSHEDIHARFPRFGLGEAAIEAAADVPEGGESFVDLQERVLGGWRNLVSQTDGETVLVVTHGGPLHLVLGHLKGQDVRTALRENGQGNCAVNEFRQTGRGHDGEAVDIVRENFTEWDEAGTVVEETFGGDR